MSKRVEFVKVGYRYPTYYSNNDYWIYLPHGNKPYFKGDKIVVNFRLEYFIHNDGKIGMYTFINPPK